MSDGRSSVRMLRCVCRGFWVLTVLMGIATSWVSTGSASERVVSKPAAAPETPPAAVSSTDYHLSTGDHVMVEVFGQPDIRTNQRLTANGDVRLPLVGRVVLQGLTLREAEQHLEQLYRKGGYFVDPQITVSVQEYSQRHIDVLGQVRNPTRITLPPEASSIGILQAITQSGGFTRIARTDAVRVTRKMSDGSTETIVVDVRDLLGTGRPGEKREFQLLVGDVVFVPERAI